MRKSSRYLIKCLTPRFLIHHSMTLPILLNKNGADLSPKKASTCHNNNNHSNKGQVNSSLWGVLDTVHLRHPRARTKPNKATGGVVDSSV